MPEVKPFFVSPQKKYTLEKIFFSDLVEDVSNLNIQKSSKKVYLKSFS